MTPLRNPSSRSGLAAGALAAALFAVGGWLRLHLPPMPATGEDFAGLASDFSWLLLASGAAIAGIAAAAGFPRSGDRRRAASLERMAVGVVAGTALAVFAFEALRCKSAIIGGQRYFWLDDDMMIPMRTAHNIATGCGIAWNPGGPRIESYSALLWGLMMAIPHLFLPLSQAPAFVLAVTGGSLALALVLAWRLCKALGLHPVERMLAVVLIALNRWLFYWSLGGSEAPLLACLVLFASLALLRASKGRPLGLGAALVIAAMAILRADAPLIGLIFVLFWIALIPSGRAGRMAWLPIILAPIAVSVWRRLYFGDWFPNSYYVRMSGVPGRGTMGSLYLLGFLSTDSGGSLAALAALHGLTGRGARARWLAAIPLAILFYGVYVGGDELPEFRFYAPIAPLMIVLAVAGGSRALRSAAGRFAPEIRRSWLIPVMAIGAFTSLLMPFRLRETGRIRYAEEEANVRIGLLLKAHTRPDAVIAHCWAGAAPYFSERTGIDMLGTCDRHIAHLPATPGDLTTAHNKYDPAYVFAQRPDVVVAAISADTVQDAAKFRDSPSRKSYPGIFRTLEDPAFDRDYRSNAVALPLSRDGHGIFIRSGSKAADPAAEWKDSGPTPK